jgi:serine/threonine protein kinase
VVTSPANGDPDDQLAARAEALDEALAAGQEPPVPVPDAEINETFSALLAAHASLRMLERVWPRAEGRTTPDQTTRVEAIPTCFGRFRMIRELGRGGFGVVFLAIDPELDRPVALKLPLAEALLKEEVRGRFVREARAAAALDHPNIVPLYEAGEIDSICYLVSAFCDGPTLAAWLRDQKSAICPLLAARLVAEMADAVRHSHERGVLHRDLKPSNVIMDIGRATWSAAAEARPRENDASNLRGTTNPARVGGAGAEQSDSPGARENPIPRISDFGLARLMDQPGEELTASFAAMGSAAYMAPEQAEGGKVGPAADIYSLGAILYVLLCNRPPHRGVNEFDTLRRVVTDAPIPPRARRSDVPRDLEAICLKCLEKDPARRYSSARELARDLERFLERRPTVARPPTAPARAFRWLRRRPAGLVFAIVAITLSLALAGTILRTGNRPETVRLSDRSIVATVAPPDDGARDPKQQSDRILYVAEMRLADRYLRDNQAAQAVEILDRRRPAAGNGDLREFIWHHLRMKCDASRRTLSGHRGAVYHVEFSPQGDRRVPPKTVPFSSGIRVRGP